MKNNPESLKACPFCGGEAEHFTIQNKDGYPLDVGGDVIECKKCHASTKVFFGEKEGLFEAWNRRPRPADGLVALDVDKVAQEIRTFDGNHDKGAGEIAEHLCAKFGTLQRTRPHACKCRRHPESAFTVRDLWDGLFECPRCGGVVLPTAKKVSVEMIDFMISETCDVRETAQAIHNLIYGAKP